MNTAVVYAHHDHQNSRIVHRVVFTGETTAVEQQTIADVFPEGGRLLIPSLAGLPPIVEGHLEPHELIEIRTVDAIPTMDMNVHDFVARLLTSHWVLSDAPLLSTTP